MRRVEENNQVNEDESGMIPEYVKALGGSGFK